MLMTLLRVPKRGLGPFRRNNSTSIHALQAAFRNPSSPFHIPHGEQGPSSPDEPPKDVNLSTKLQDPNETPSASSREVRAKLTKFGYDPESFWEQPIVWGDHDAFQHVNNVRYLRFFESARIFWMRSIANDLGGPSKADAMIKAQGISLILKSISLNFKRPVTYPDTLLIAQKPHMPSTTESRFQFNLSAVAYSYAQRALVCDSDCVLVWYDYDKLKKTDPGQEAWDVLRKRMSLGTV